IGGSVAGSLHESAVPDIRRAAESGGAVIVHGGGRDVTEVSSRMGHEARFITSPSGVRSRYTDLETAGIFTMVMAGRVNKAIVRSLRAGGVNAVGVCGIDGGLIMAERKKRLLIVNERGRKQAIDGGYTGRVSRVEPRLADALLGAGFVPVIAPVALGEGGEALNIDGDRAAAAMAGATRSDRAIFVTDVDGISMDGGLVGEIGAGEARQMRPRIGAGMEKKVIAALEALEAGVGEAIIASGRRENPISAAMAHERCTVIRP
ncbi:MAG: [LysW]-aminoadipate/[LysW]-glutamate kinase, partial [Thaumarchaeota archaeon S15]